MVWDKIHDPDIFTSVLNNNRFLPPVSSSSSSSFFAGPLHHSSLYEIEDSK